MKENCTLTNSGDIQIMDIIFLTFRAEAVPVRGAAFARRKTEDVERRRRRLRPLARLWKDDCCTDCACGDTYSEDGES